jgi:hypothetical protein
MGGVTKNALVLLGFRLQYLHGRQQYALIYFFGGGWRGPILQYPHLVKIWLNFTKNSILKIIIIKNNNLNFKKKKPHIITYTIDMLMGCFWDG